MANNTLDDLFFSAQGAHERAYNSAGTQTILVDAVVAAILTAVTSGLFTCTYNASGKASQDVQWVLEQLRLDGYTVTVSGSTWTISW
jgi:hypothetical protein